MVIRLATPDIQADSIVDGEGIRGVLWTQGCNHKCPSCQNPQTHSFTGGYLIDIKDVEGQIDALEGQDGITFSGGDPFYQPTECAILAKYIRKKGMNVWCYTGFTYEELIQLGAKNKSIMDFLQEIDVLVDGLFMLELKSLDCPFRGSTNQRIIDVPKSLKTGSLCLVEKYYQNNITNKKIGLYV